MLQKIYCKKNMGEWQHSPILHTVTKRVSLADFQKQKKTGTRHSKSQELSA